MSANVKCSFEQGSQNFLEIHLAYRLALIYSSQNCRQKVFSGGFMFLQGLDILKFDKTSPIYSAS